MAPASLTENQSNGGEKRKPSAPMGRNKKRSS